MKTKEKFFKNSTGKIIILEGLWNTGKTTLCEYLKKFYGLRFIEEPNHIKAEIKMKTREDITNWYFKEHLRNLKKAFKLADKGRNITVERSPISTLAFAKAFFSENLSLDKQINEMKYLFKKYKNRPHLILLKHPNYSSLVESFSQDKETVIYSSLEFLKKFEKYLISFCHLFEKNNFFLVVKLNSNKHLTENFQKIVSKIL